MTFSKRQLPKKSQNLSDWYNAVVPLAELADYGPAKGTMIFRPYSYALWENVQKYLDKEFKKSGVENAYFPLFIPESLFKKEKEHVEGFAPECAVVTIGGNEELKDKLIVRPTSEMIMYESYARWIKSWRDLPVLINQWNNVVRWEKRTYLFLRTSEFLWQEGHCAHATREESWERVMWGINTYAQTYREMFALPCIVGRKSESEKFAGGDVTLTCELLMPEGKALQGCTSHDLGQNFSKVLDIKFQDKDGQNKFVWQNSWGFTTRSIGALIMAHGDDAGLVFPPAIAPIQVVILPVKQTIELADYGHKLLDVLDKADIRAKFDDREGESLGYKINKWELRGVPMRLEVGEKEMASNEFVITRRDGVKTKVSENKLVQIIKEQLQGLQHNLYQNAQKFLQQNTHEVDDYQKFKEVMAGPRGFIKAFWCTNPICEAKIKEETKASTRCLPLDATDEKGECAYCGKAATHRWVWAIAY